MRRPYTAAMYARVAEGLARARPGLGLGADVIVGHPGETESDFEATLALVEALPFSYLHVFPYSDRRGTEAASMDGRVDPRTAARRSRRLREVAHRKNRLSPGARGDHAEVVSRTLTPPAGLCNYVEVALEGPDALMRAAVGPGYRREREGDAWGDGGMTAKAPWDNGGSGLYDAGLTQARWRGCLPFGDPSDE
jgi:threonylcarbamoyladenosine tRNA methylthiotransferase MtaB